ncbi:hypothetical protein SAMN05444583_108109 [Rhodococcus maanshanensis]|uniref:Uncharacterized protein n=1 Tax=Rhodococcus maanshanensis TaxID=183556 RepID=A0A1H7PN57_9NOCA|nr:hypothetical protein SAMN05444583_108109 [Rhodococcus maanshanensis]
MADGTHSTAFERAVSVHISTTVGTRSPRVFGIGCRYPRGGGGQLPSEPVSRLPMPPGFCGFGPPLAVMVTVCAAVVC